MSNLTCVFCKGAKIAKVKEFSNETFQKCREVADHRSKKHSARKSIYSDIKLPCSFDTCMGYHSTCYKNFTAVKIPNKITDSQENVVDCSTSADPINDIGSLFDEGASMLRTSEKLDDEQEADDSMLGEESTDDENTSRCIICDKFLVYHKRRAAHLIQGTEAFPKYIKAVATQYNNIDMLEKIKNLNDDSGFFYHKHCKSKFEWICKNDSEKQKESYWHKQRQSHTDAYAKLCIFIRERVVENNECLFYNFISEKYVKLLHEEYDGVSSSEKPDFFSSRNLEKKLLETFHKEIKITFSDNKKYITPYTGHIISNLEFFKTMETRQAIYNVGQIIRQEIIGMDPNKLPEDITVQNLIRGECDSVPQLLSYLLECIVCGDNKSISKNRHELKKSSRELKMFSLGQDIIYAVSNGNIKTSKHVTLGMALKSLSSSKKIVNLINKYGHCCSYNVIEELETEITFSTTLQNKLLPEDIIPADNLCTGIAFDNFDRFVDTLTGKDTLHDTVGIIYQNIPDDTNIATSTDDTVHVQDQIPNAQTQRARKRRRCFNAITSEIEPYTKKPKIDSHFTTPSINQNLVKPEIFAMWRNVDLAWLLSHKLGIPDTPMWTGYNSLIMEDNSPMQKVSYLTPINESPTNNSVVHLTLKIAQQIAEECNSKYMQVTYDLAIARIAFGIQCQEAPKFDNIFIHLGGFHIIMSYFKAVGSFIEDCGITNIMVDSEILANGSLKGFITGTNFNRCKRLHPLLSLAFQKLHFDAFVDREKIVIDKSVEDFLLEFQNCRSRTPTIKHEATLKLIEKYNNFMEQTLEGKFGLTAQFYAAYIQLISYYNMLNKSVRTGNLNMYVYILAKMANIFFAFNHQNYSRWLVYYISKLCSIDDTHPGLRLSLEQGSFGVRRTEKPFSRIPVDLTLEQTINGEAARRLTGIIHMTNSLSARQRWAISHSVRARIISHVLKTAGIAKNQDITSELKISRIRNSHHQVEKFIRILEQNVNPFDTSLDADKLYNITTGEAAPRNVADFLLNVESVGQTLRDKFISEVKDIPTRFQDSIKRNPVFTFSTVKKKKKVLLGGKMQELRLQRDLFGRLLALSLEKRISLEKVLCYPITPMPLSLCHIDGTINKTDKSALMRDLEKKVESTEPESVDVLIIDGFFLLHTLKDIPRTFGDLSKKLLHILCKHNVARIDLIFDRYFCPSIKDTEHGLRESITSVDFHISGPQQVRPSDFSRALKNIKFKEALVKFLIKNWSQQEMAKIIAKKIININHDMCYAYSVEDGMVVQTINEDLTCQEHEEADTKIIYHICQIDQQSRVAIRCSDTDILIIMLGNMEFLKSSIKIWMDVGVGNSRRYIDVSRLYEILGSSLARSLPAFHAMTGCDYNPAFYRKGKKRPFTMLKNSIRYQKAFADIGRCTSDAGNVLDVLEEFTCRLYNEKQINDVNSARLNIFMKTYKINSEHTSTTLNLNLSNYDACNLPPCKSELEQQLLRTKYIAQIWNSAHTKNLTDLNPEDFGWYDNEGRYYFSWFSGSQLPELSNIILDEESTSAKEKPIEDLDSDLESDFDDDDDDNDDESDNDY